MREKLKVEPIEEPNKIISYWKKEWRVGLLILFSGLVFDGSMSVGPIVQGKIIDLIVAGENRHKIINFIILYVILICGIQFARFLKRFYVRIFANKTNATMRLMVYNNIMNKDVDELKDEKVGDLMTKAISDVGACVEGMRKFTTEVFDTGVLMTTYFVTMLIYDVKVTVVACIFIPVAMLLAEKLKKIIYKYSDSYRKQVSRVTNLAYENVDNQLLFRVNSVDDIRADLFSDEIEDLRKKSIKANLLENSMQPVYNAIAMIGIMGIVHFGGTKVIAGGWTVGQFSAYITIFIAFAVKAAKAAKLFNSVHKAQISWKRIKPFLTGYTENKTSEIETIEPIRLEVENLNFRKVRDASFTVETGQIIGVTGPVASGKSTLGVVLQGLYDYGGSIKINGKELRNIPQEEVSRLVAYMGHDSQLLSDTIHNNITLGHSGNIAEVLQDVAFDVDLNQMEKGVDTVIGNRGIRLSGGQQSRIALARTLYNKSSILVLDDPFAAVDAATELRIIENLKEHYNDTAIILISHRVACFSSLDNVLIVDDGHVEQGSHERLLECSQVYRDIYLTQMGGDSHDGH